MKTIKTSNYKKTAGQEYEGEEYLVCPFCKAPAKEVLYWIDDSLVCTNCDRIIEG